MPMSDLHTRTATFASLKCRSKCDIFAPKVGTKIRENEPFSLTTRQAHASLVYPFLPRLLLSQQVPSDKSRQHQSSPLPSQSKCNKQIITENKKQQANLACCFFIFLACCILISYSVNLIPSNPNSTSNL